MSSLNEPMLLRKPDSRVRSVVWGVVKFGTLLIPTQPDYHILKNPLPWSHIEVTFGRLPKFAPKHGDKGAGAAISQLS
jgi:hypothetical protein